MNVPLGRRTVCQLKSYYEMASLGKKESSLLPAMSMPLFLSKLPEKPGWMAELLSCHEPGTGCLAFYRFIPLAASHIFLKYRTGAEECCEELPWLGEDNSQQPNRPWAPDVAGS